MVVVVLCEGGEGGVGPFKILRKHLRKEGKGASAGRVDVSRDPVSSCVAVRYSQELKCRPYSNAYP